MEGWMDGEGDLAGMDESGRWKGERKVSEHAESRSGRQTIIIGGP